MSWALLLDALALLCTPTVIPPNVFAHTAICDYPRGSFCLLPFMFFPSVLLSGFFSENKSEA